jgi:hypothetical protein
MQPILGHLNETLVGLWDTINMDLCQNNEREKK